MATLRGSRIFLSNREYQIFAKMVEHPDGEATRQRDQILSEANSLGFEMTPTGFELSKAQVDFVPQEITSTSEYEIRFLADSIYSNHIISKIDTPIKEVAGVHFVCVKFSYDQNNEADIQILSYKESNPKIKDSKNVDMTNAA